MAYPPGEALYSGGRQRETSGPSGLGFIFCGQQVVTCTALQVGCGAHCVGSLM